MSKPQPKEETILLEEDMTEDHQQILSQNELLRVLSACGFQVLPIVTEDEKYQNAPTSDKFH